MHPVVFGRGGSCLELYKCWLTMGLRVQDIQVVGPSQGHGFCLGLRYLSGETGPNAGPWSDGMLPLD